MSRFLNESCVLPLLGNANIIHKPTRPRYILGEYKGVKLVKGNILQCLKLSTIWNITKFLKQIYKKKKKN